ncbi:MAG: DNA polymerase III subunit alpha, partial [bacterium]|nr:DNA polymerase III subunit alpha [bacterium]
MTHLHVHSHYSLLEGVAGVRQLVARAVEHGMKALALTDTDAMHGAIPFYKVARHAGVNPILGVQLGHAVVLARDRAGYSALCRMVTAYRLEDEFRLIDHVDGAHVLVLTSDYELIGELTGCGIEPLVGITHSGSSRSRYQAGRLREYAMRKGLRPVAVQPVYYLDKAHARIQRVLAAIRMTTTVDALHARDAAPPNAWFRSPKEMRSLYGEWPETLDNLEWVAEQCDIELELGTPLFPESELPEGETAFSWLWKQTFDGVKARYQPLTPDVIGRMKYELDVIGKLGFAPYFLIVADIVRYARDRDIPIVGRGSAANSLVAHALGITRVDPFKYDLYFERFLHLKRSDCPDIDLDICWHRRDQIIDYVYDRYGADRVAMICTLNTFQARSALREVAKAMGLTDQEIGETTRHLPHYRASDVRTVVDHLPECRGLRMDEEPLKSILAVSEFIDGFPRHLSVHPCGVVIAPRALTNFVPLQRATKGILITQYDMGPVEDLGLVKMDLLGNRSLTVIDDTVAKVWENRGIRVDVEQVPDPDPLTADLIREGRTLGCFQIESPAMRALLQHTQADNTDMLIKTLSLVRPGPSGSGMKKRFIDRRLGKEETVHLHPSLERVLGDTYGVMLYQEDILKVANAIAGMDLAEADLLRRAMSKKRSQRDMARSMKTFLEKAHANGIGEDVAETIWGLIANFAEYSYCKAHASTYGEIAYQAAYLKAHFPVEFLSSVLSNRGGFYHPAVYLEEAKRLGIPVRPPDVNRSQVGYEVEGDAIRVGFVEVGHVTQPAIQAMLDAREEGPFRGLTDLMRRTGMGFSDAEGLIRAGACDGFGLPRPMVLWQLNLLKGSKATRTNGSEPDSELFADDGVAQLTPRLPDYSARNRADLEWKALGLTTFTHPLAYYLPLLTERTLVLSTYLKEYTDRTVTLAGWLIAERRVGLKGRG